jgi:hypothetical protein
MFVTADQLVAHAVGDYVLQSDWMATEKTKRSVAALVHAVSYTLPFAFLTLSPLALLFIASTHFLIDRFRLARYVAWAKNFLAPRHIKDYVEVLPFNRTQHLILRRNHPWAACSTTGYHRDRPPFLAVWLLIALDNVMHVLLNALALRYL